MNLYRQQLRLVLTADAPEPPAPVLPAPAEHLVRIDTMLPSNEGYRGAGLEGLQHNPPLLLRRATKPGPSGRSRLFSHTLHRISVHFCSKWALSVVPTNNYVGTSSHSREYLSMGHGHTLTIRHTVRTWLAEQGVPDPEADVFMGHKEEGSATGRRYKHRRPEYLRGVTEGIEALFDALSQLVRRPFKGRELIDQPAPDDPVCVTARGNCVAGEVTGLCNCLNLERETRLRLPL